MPVPHSRERADFYAAPAIYDILHTPGTAAEVAALERLAHRFVPRRRLTILEPACGTGRYLRLLSAHGHCVLGFDRDPGMVAYASARMARFGRRSTVVRGHMESFNIARPAFIDLAFTPINSIRHLQTDRAMLAHFSRIARVLKPEGVYVVGLSITVYGLEEPTEDVWEGVRGPCHVKQVVQYLPAPGSGGRGARDERVISHMTVRTPRRTRHIDSMYTLRSYDLHQWHRLIARSPFEIAAIVDESGGDLTFSPPGYAVFVLRRRMARPL